MSEQREIREPGELVYPARPSWAPAFFALGALGAVCGVFIGFMVPGWIYAVAGIVLMLFALRSMVRGAQGDYFRLPRKQHTRGAVLPVEKIKFPLS